MFFAPIVALLTLAEPAGPPTSADDPTVIVDQPVTPIAPAAEPEVPAAPATQQPALTAPPIPTTAAPLPSPPPAETVEEPGPASPPAPPPVRPDTTFGLEFGYAHGGDRFLEIAVPPPTTAKSASAGDGLFFCLAGSWTPYWNKRGGGIGVYARAGAKYVKVGDGATSASFLRYPLAAGAQVLLPVVGRWFALGRLGLITEVLGQLTVTIGGASRSSTDLSPTLGQFLDAGVYWAATEYSGFAAIARYERLDISYAGGTANASNFGALASAFLGF